MNASTIPLKQHLNEVDLFNKQIKNLNEEIRLLKERLVWFEKQIFGQRSEKIVESDSTQFLFELPSLPSESEKKTPNKSSKQRYEQKNSNKITFPDNLPIERIVIDLKNEDKICSQTGKPLIKIGEEVSQTGASTRKLLYQRNHTSKVCNA